MYSFDELISKADTNFLDSLLPEGAALIIRQLDKNLAYPSHLKKLLLELKSPQSLLLDKRTRNELILLMPKDKAINLLETLGQKSISDPFGALQQLSLSKKPDKEVFLSFFGIQHTEEEKKEVESDTEVLDGSYTLFDHQISALTEVRELLSEDGSKVLLHMPTGSGKTRTAVTFACEYLRSKRNRVVVWLANSEELCEQAHAEFARAWTSLGNRKIQSLRFWGNYNPDILHFNDGFIVLGLAKAYATLKSDGQKIGDLSSKAPLVIFDEAHQVVADTYRLVTEILLRPFSPSRLLGLSATPGRSLQDLDSDAELSNFFNRKKVTLKVEGYNNPVSYLIDQEYLAKPIFRSISSGTNVEITKEDEENISRYLELPKSILDKLANDQKRNLLIVHQAELLLKNHKRVILFASSVSQSDLLACVLKARGLNAQSVTSNTNPVDRTRFINSYKDSNEEPKILCNFGILTTGFDAPKTSAALVARPTISLVLYSQMIGRALRGIKAGGNKEAEIVTILDEGIEQFKSIEKAFSNWEDVWTN